MTTMAATASGLRPVGAERVSVEEAAGEDQLQLSRGQTAAVVLSVGLGMVVAGYGLAGSYLSISELADRHHVPLAALVPAGIDDGLVAVVVLDLALTWIGTGGLVAATGTSSLGGHGRGQRGRRLARPGRRRPAYRRATDAVGNARSRPQRAATPDRRGTWYSAGVDSAYPVAAGAVADVLLWRMALWQITSYRTAIDTELALRRAVTELRAHHGRRWRRRAPADLVWMLRTGVSVNEAVARVQRLAGIDDAVETVRSVLPDTLVASSRTSTERKAHVAADQASAPAGAFGRRPRTPTVIDSPRRYG
jgi:hypothetical protein